MFSSLLYRVLDVATGTEVRKLNRLMASGLLGAMLVRTPCLLMRVFRFQRLDVVPRSRRNCGNIGVHRSEPAYAAIFI